MITVKESHPFSADFAHACRENYGRDYMGRIGPKSARELCGMYPLPRVGEETVVALRPNGPRLYVANISGHYVLRSAQSKVDQWPEMFGVRFVRKVSNNEILAGIARAFADNETISQKDYRTIAEHDATTNNDRDALARILHGNPNRTPGGAIIAGCDDHATVRELADYIERTKDK